MNLCVVILTISTYIFHLRNILIYVQDLLVFHCKTIFIHAYIDESLTRLPTLPTPSPRGLLSTVTCIGVLAGSETGEVWSEGFIVRIHVEGMGSCRAWSSDGSISLGQQCGMREREGLN